MIRGPLFAIALAAACRREDGPLASETGAVLSETGQPPPAATAETGGNARETATSYPVATGETGRRVRDTGDTGDTADTAHGAHTGDTGRPPDTAPPLDTSETGRTTDTGDTAVATGTRDTADTAGAGLPADTGALCPPFEGPSPPTNDTAMPPARRVGAWDVPTEAAATFVGELGDTGASYWYGNPIYEGDEAGKDVDGIGDVDADGFGDVAIMADRPSGPAFGSKVYVLDGPQSGVVDLSAADASFEPGADLFRVWSAGDLDGDGAADLAVSGFTPDRLGVIAGASATGALDLGDLLLSVQGLPVYEIQLAASDLDGDGIDDLAVGDDTFSGYFGRVSIVPGGSAGSIDPALLANEILGSSANEAIGIAMASADIDGDGIDDLMVGSNPASVLGIAFPGDVLLFEGPVLGSLTRGDAAGEIAGEATLAAAVSAVAPGDLDGDGYQDLVVGAGNFGGAYPFHPSAYVFYGPIPACGPRPVTDAPAELVKTADPPLAGYYDPLGDFDGDGFDDLLIHVSQEATFDVGYGPFSGTVEVDSAAGFAEFSAPEFLAPAAPAGDVNGDGLADLLMGAPNADLGGGTDSGGAWLLLGGF